MLSPCLCLIAVLVFVRWRLCLLVMPVYACNAYACWPCCLLAMLVDCYGRCVLCMPCLLYLLAMLVLFDCHSCCVWLQCLTCLLAMIVFACNAMLVNSYVKLRWLCLLATLVFGPRTCCVCLNLLAMLIDLILLSIVWLPCLYVLFVASSGFYFGFVTFQITDILLITDFELYSD